MLPQNISESHIHSDAISNSTFAPFNHINYNCIVYYDWFITLGWVSLLSQTPWLVGTRPYCSYATECALNTVVCILSHLYVSSLTCMYPLSPVFSNAVYSSRVAQLKMADHTLQGVYIRDVLEHMLQTPEVQLVFCCWLLALQCW